MPKKPLRVSIPKDIVAAAMDLKRAKVNPDEAALALGVNRATYHKITNVGEMPLFQRSTVDSILKVYDLRLVSELIAAQGEMSAAQARMRGVVEELYRRIKSV